MRVERDTFGTIERSGRPAFRPGGLLPFQSSLHVDAVCRVNNPPEIAALSVPRGNGKSLVMRRAGSAVADAG